MIWYLIWPAWWANVALGLAESPAGSAATPNFVVILADDLGYGDVACYNPTRGKIPTPNLDRLASQGMRFTDAHSSSACCSPTRYALLTGRYHWRTRLQQGIVNVWGQPLIAPARLTIAGLAKQHGYHTACVGKWHLGWDWPISAEQKQELTGLGGQPGGGGSSIVTQPTGAQRAAWKSIFSQPIPGGPTQRGFDEYFGTDVPNWPPYCFIENDRTVGIPTTLLAGKQLERNQASYQGPALPEWKLDAVLPALADRAGAIIQRQAATGAPFLLYLPLTSPHTPLAVAQPWRGASQLNAYADFVMQTDAVVGQVLTAIDQAGIADHTVVVFTSDNGCAAYIGVKDLEAKGHFPSGPLRGYKADAWEGGHRVPFLVRWPGKVKPGTTCQQTICSVDLLATFAEILGATLPANAGEDSASLLPLLRGQEQPIHEGVVHHSATGVFALRSGKWKLIFGRGSGPADNTKPQLYDLEADLGETQDRSADHPEKVAELTARLQNWIAEGRSTPGAAQANDVPVQLIKDAVRPRRPAKKKRARQLSCRGSDLPALPAVSPGMSFPGSAGHVDSSISVDCRNRPSRKIRSAMHSRI